MTLNLGGVYVAVKADAPKAFTAAGMHIPENQQRLGANHPGEIIAMGPGYDGSPLKGFSVGQRVLFRSQCAQEITDKEFSTDGKPWYLIRFDDLICSIHE